MTPPPRLTWRPLTLTLCASWLAATGVVIALATVVALPAFLAKAGPFFLAGLVTVRIVGAPARTPAIIATALLAVVARLGWTAFSFATRDLAVDRALVLLGASLPVTLIASVWAYVGMMLAGRPATPPPRTPTMPAARDAPPPHEPTQAELDDLEQELAREIARERDGAPRGPA